MLSDDYFRMMSKRKLRNLWQKYEIKDDSLHLKFHSFQKTYKIPFDKITNVEIRPPIVIGDIFRRRYSVFTHLRTLKMDFCDFNRHLVVEKEGGFLKQLRFTPVDLEGFFEELKLKYSEYISEKQK